MSRLFSRSLPRLDWIQVEVTSHCNAACIYCPCTVYRDHWQRRHLSLQTFKKILPFCPSASMIHLQGWGEPFLNPDFLEMIHLAKRQGCRVGTTTNGTLTDRTRLSRIVDLGLDIMAFSLAGTDASNDVIRKGTTLEQVLKSIECLNSLKHDRQTSKPEIHIAYMLLSSGLENLAGLPDLMQGLGIRQAVISTLDFIGDDRLAEASFIPDHQTLDNLKNHLDLVVRDGRSRGLDIHYQIPGGRQPGSCSENVLKSLVISSDGTVSPCVFTNMPLTGGDGLQKGRARAYIPLHLGNIHSLPLDRIWWRKEARALRKAFTRHRYPLPCIDCPKRRTVTDQVIPLSTVRDYLNVLD